MSAGPRISDSKAEGQGEIFLTGEQSSSFLYLCFQIRTYVTRNSLAISALLASYVAMNNFSFARYRWKKWKKNTTVLSSPFQTYLYPFCQGTNFNERMICMKWCTKIYQRRTYIGRYLISKSCSGKCETRAAAWFEGQWVVSFRFFWNPALQSAEDVWSVLQSSLHTNGNISTW